jgi:2-oxo-4-hydroxy-4-carboxy-5-ureidoimidazoline decarboxylase
VPVSQILRWLCLLVTAVLLAAWLVTGESAGMGAEELARFNALPAADAHDELLTCCHSPVWAERMTSGRPYSSAKDAVRQSSAIVAMLTVADLEAALSAHPRIGERPDADEGRSAAWSAQEQAGVADVDEETARELVEFNLEYEQRFGHIYLVSAAGRTAAQLLTLLRKRLRNTPAAEWQAVRTELQKINEIRLTKMLAGTR